MKRPCAAIYNCHIRFPTYVRLHPRQPGSQSPPPTYSLFSQRAIDVATFIGGPFAGTLLIGVNYHRLGNTNRRNQAILGGLLATLLLFWILFNIPDAILDKIPNIVFTGLNVWLVHLASSKLLSKRLELHYQSSGQKASNWATIGLSVVGLIVTLASMLLYLPMVKPFDFEGEVTKFGLQENEIYHAADLPEKTISDLAAILTESEYFNDEYQAVAQIKARIDLYEISLAFQRSYWKDSELIAYLREFDQTLETELGTKVDIYLVDSDLTKTYRESLDKIQITPSFTPGN